MARIKHTTKVHGALHAPQKQLNLIKKLKSRMQDKYGVKKMAIRKASSQQQEGEKRKHRWRSGTVAKREIRKQTRSTNLLFPKSTFSRCAGICVDYLLFSLSLSLQISAACA